MSTPTHKAPPRCSDLNGYHNLSVNSANSSPVNGTNNHDHVIATSGVSPSDTANSNSSVKSSSDNGLGVVQSVLNINKSLVQLKQDTSPLRQPLKKKHFALSNYATKWKHSTKCIPKWAKLWCQNS